MRIGVYEFRPGLVPTIVTIVMLPILIALGFWQLDRAQQKRDMIAAMQAGLAKPGIDLNRDHPGWPDIKHRAVSAVGRFDDGHQFLVDNQTLDGEAGYAVLTPLMIQGSHTAVLVDRGWVPWPGGTRAMPHIEVDENLVSVHGLVDQGPTTGMRLGGPAEDTSGWPRRLAYVDFKYLQAQLPYKLLPYVIRVSGPAPFAYRKDWSPRMDVGLSPSRHLGYAAQWFGLATTLVVIFLSVNLRRTPRDSTE